MTEYVIFIPTDEIEEKKWPLQWTTISEISTDMSTHKWHVQDVIIPKLLNAIFHQNRFPYDTIITSFR